MTKESLKLLPIDALKNVCISLSVSESLDLERLGLSETHFRLAIGELARCVLISGGKILYGGNLRENGYTLSLLNELQRYSRRDRPLNIVLPWSEHRALPLSAIEKLKKDLQLFGTIICLDINGAVIQPNLNRQENPVVISREDAVTSLTSMRQYSAEQSSGRLLIGGKTSGFVGRIPGLIEEAIFTIKAKKPLYLAGGFGGATLEIIEALDLDKREWFPKLESNQKPDEKLQLGLAEIGKLQNKKWAILNNGLTDEENLKLSTSHRPSEIAALVSLGLGRTFCK